MRHDYKLYRNSINTHLTIICEYVKYGLVSNGCSEIYIDSRILATYGIKMFQWKCVLPLHSKCNLINLNCRKPQTATHNPSAAVGLLEIFLAIFKRKRKFFLLNLSGVNEENIKFIHTSNT